MTPARYNLGSDLFRQDRWDEARAHYERALAIDPFHVRAMNNLGAGLDLPRPGRARGGPLRAGAGDCAGER